VPTSRELGASAFLIFHSSGRRRAAGSGRSAPPPPGGPSPLAARESRLSWGAMGPGLDERLDRGCSGSKTAKVLTGRPRTLHQPSGDLAAPLTPRRVREAWRADRPGLANADGEAGDRAGQDRLLHDPPHAAQKARLGSTEVTGDRRPWRCSACCSFQQALSSRAKTASGAGRGLFAGGGNPPTAHRPATGPPRLRADRRRRRGRGTRRRIRRQTSSRVYPASAKLPSWKIAKADPDRPRQRWTSRMTRCQRRSGRGHGAVRAWPRRCTAIQPAGRPKPTCGRGPPPAEVGRGRFVLQNRARPSGAPRAGRAASDPRVSPRGGGPPSRRSTPRLPFTLHRGRPAPKAGHGHPLTALCRDPPPCNRLLQGRSRLRARRRSSRSGRCSRLCDDGRAGRAARTDGKSWRSRHYRSIVEFARPASPHAGAARRRRSMRPGVAPGHRGRRGREGSAKETLSRLCGSGDAGDRDRYPMPLLL